MQGWSTYCHRRGEKKKHFHFKYVVKSLQFGPGGKVRRLKGNDVNALNSALLKSNQKSRQCFAPRTVSTFDLDISILKNMRKRVPKTWKARRPHSTRIARPFAFIRLRFSYLHVPHDGPEQFVFLQKTQQERLGVCCECGGWDEDDDDDDDVAGEEEEEWQVLQRGSALSGTAGLTSLLRSNQGRKQTKKMQHALCSF